MTATALDPVQSAVARRELADAERLSSAGPGSYWIARERGTAALVGLARALGVDERGIGLIENLVMAADAVSDDYESAGERGLIIDESTSPFNCLRDMRPTEVP